MIFKYLANIFFFNFALIFAQDRNEQIQYYENLITNAVENCLDYQPPKNSEEYAAHGEVTTYGTFDYIIIGAGAAGTVIANRLSANPNRQVLLIEAGTFGNNLTEIPNMYYPVECTSYNWGYVSVPQKTACLGMIDQKCTFPRGKGVGGCTLINGLVYSRGSSLDFDKWEALGNPGWSYKDVLSIFKKSESFHRRDPSAPVDPTVHGCDGELNVEYHLPRSPQLDGFLNANRDLGYKISDYNSGTGLGASPAQFNTKDGRRFDDGKAFIHKILGRKNLHVLTKSFVTKILINESTKTAHGVAFNHDGRRYEAHVDREVILSAGAINSPQILMLSGIGPKEHLASLKIPLIQDLEVGSALKDHARFYGLNFKTTYKEPVKPPSENIKDYLNGVGFLAQPGSIQGVGFYESSYTKGTGLPDIELVMVPANATSDLAQGSVGFTNETYEDLWAHNDRTNTFIIYVVGLHAESFGTIRLKSSNPLDYPLIDPNFLSDEEDKDINTLLEGIHLTLNLTNSKSFKQMGTTLQGGPLRACSQHEYQTREYWVCAIRQVTKHLFHPVGTCPMGANPAKGAVVDAKLRVYGVKRLRVADASIFPTTLAGHPNAPTVMIGEKVSQMIITDE